MTEKSKASKTPVKKVSSSANANKSTNKTVRSTPKAKTVAIKPKTTPASASKASKTPITAFPDSWSIDEVKGKNVLTFYKQDFPIMKLELDAEMIAPLLEELNDNFVLDSDIADAWTYRVPAEGDIDILTLFRDGQPLGSLPVDKVTGFKMWTSLSKFKPSVDVKGGFKKWVMKHKIQAALVAVILIITIVIPFFSMIVNYFI
jgi:hypothetical protein